MFGGPQLMSMFLANSTIKIFFGMWVEVRISQVISLDDKGVSVHASTPQSTKIDHVPSHFGLYLV